MVKTPKWPIPLGSKPIDLGLERVFEALKRLGNPNLKLPQTIHVAGTNGKGSTIAFLRAILEAWGKKVHVYTSPHLVEFNERIVLAGKEISDEFLNEVLEETKQKCEDIKLTFFEGTTVAAILAFSKIPADFVILETGMGGRLDATNICKKTLSIITPVSLDHMEFLGNTLLEIAYEKASIIKPDSTVIISRQAGEALMVIKNFADSKNTKTKILERDFDYHVSRNGNFTFRSGKKDIALSKPSLAGSHQYINAATAIEAALILNAPDKAIKQGITTARWKARMQKLSNNVYLDGGHNVQAAGIIKDFILEENARDKKKNIAILGMLKTKDFRNFIIELSKIFDEIIITRIPGEENCRDPQEIKQICDEINISSKIIEQPKDALKSAKASDTRVMICGSLYLAGYVLENKLN